MTLRRKLLVAFSIMTVPLLVIGGLTLWNIREENQALRALEEGLGRVRIFAELESAVHRQGLEKPGYTTRREGVHRIRAREGGGGDSTRSAGARRPAVSRP